MRECPPGTYGSNTGLTSPSCSGLCEEGYYCPIGSTSPQQHQCGDPSVYCPIGSIEPQPVSNGYFTGLTLPPSLLHLSLSCHSWRRNSNPLCGEKVLNSLSSCCASLSLVCRCIPGQYCVNGRQYFCQSGHWGGEYGQVDYPFVSILSVLFLTSLSLRMSPHALGSALLVSIVLKGVPHQRKSCVVIQPDIALTVAHGLSLCLLVIILLVAIPQHDLTNQLLHRVTMQ
jgi:hypothetical protein